MAKFLFGIAVGLVGAIQFVPLETPLFYGFAWTAVFCGVLGLFARV